MVLHKKKLHETRTFWTGVAGILAAAAGFFTGEVELGPALQTGVAGLIGIFLRSGMLE